MFYFVLLGLAYFQISCIIPYIPFWKKWETLIDLTIIAIALLTGGLLRRDDEALHAPGLRQPERGQHQVGREVPRGGGRAARRD